MTTAELPEWQEPAKDHERRTYCSCGTQIVWRRAPCRACGGKGRDLAGACAKCKGAGDRPHPIDIPGGSHFATCRLAASFRRR